MIDGNITAGMFTKRDVVGLLKCSPRTVDRLIATEQIPAPVRIGTLVRWPREVVDPWISTGAIAQNLPKRPPIMVCGAPNA